jgi:hypothetical protein
MSNINTLPITDEQEDLEEAYERTRIDSLPLELQSCVAEHHWNALQATRSYVESQARTFVQEVQG